MPAPRDISRCLAISPVIPVVTLADTAIAVATAQALLEGGLGIMEVTLRAAGALECIGAVARQVPQMCVGAGTVINSPQLQDAIAAGAQFAVSPGLTVPLLDSGREVDVPYLPGAATASEVMVALDMGYRYLKFFPASLAGGPQMLGALAAPFPQVRFCATGGISARSCGAYLALPNVACVGGSWVTPATALAARDWTRIRKLAAQAAALRRNKEGSA